MPDTPDYAYYQNVYQGSSIPLAEFPACMRDASSALERYKRIYTVTAPDASSEKMALCAMADAVYYFTAAQSGALTSSVSVGSVSCSRAQTQPDTSPAAQSRELYRCAGLYLDINRRA